MLVPELLLKHFNRVMLCACVCNGFYAYGCVYNNNNNNITIQKKYRRLADEDDELSEVQPGIYIFSAYFLFLFALILSCAVV